MIFSLPTSSIEKYSLCWRTLYERRDSNRSYSKNTWILLTFWTISKTFLYTSYFLVILFNIQDKSFWFWNSSKKKWKKHEMSEFLRKTTTACSTYDFMQSSQFVRKSGANSTFLCAIRITQRLTFCHYIWWFMDW